MTKLQRIENELDGIDGAKFHRLCNAFLSREGYKQIHAVGLVVGKDKSKTGTPDTLLTLPTGKYVFVEITTKEADPGKKFLKDIVKCFDEAKTGIPVAKIEQIILCYNGELTTAETESTRNVCQQNGCSLEIYGLSALAPALYNRYPDLAKNFLGVEIDTRQILEADSFVQTYGRNQLATPLDTPFYGREQEIEVIAKRLAESNVLILSGRPGSGKTRIALEAIERFQQANPAFQSKCILYHGENLNDDIHAYFSAPGFYIILVDDANRISALDSLLYLVQEQKQGRTIKLILTVRDYALDKLITAVAEVSSVEPIEIQPFNFERLSQMLAMSSAILDEDYLERIFEISIGNPRLALMCAQIANDNQTLNSLRNVADLYAKYYQSLRKDIIGFEDRNLLNIVAIVAFLRVVDFTNEEQMTKITDAFGISPSVFCEKARRLYDLEVVDFYENEVVKVSDQVLATYLFYIAVFEQKTLHFGDIIRHYFPKFRGLFIEVLNPLVSSFDSELILRVLAQSTTEFWNGWLTEQSKETQCTFLSTFWFIRPDLSLDALETLIDNLAENLEQDVPAIQHELNVFAEGKIVGIFSALQLYGDNFVTALKLALKFLAIHPSDEKQIIQLLIKKWGFQYKDYLYGYERQQIIIKILWLQCDTGQNALMTRVFFDVAKSYLQTQFETVEHRGSQNSITLTRFALEPVPQLQELRGSLWDWLFTLYNQPEWQESVKLVIEAYCSNNYKSDQTDLLEQEASKLFPFLNQVLDPDSYADCLLMQNLLQMYRRRKIEVDTAYGQRFESVIWSIAKLMINDRYELRQHSQLGVENSEQRKKNRLVKFVHSYDAALFVQFLDRCREIQLYYTQRNQPWEIMQIHQMVSYMLEHLGTEQPDLFEAVIPHTIGLLNPYQAVSCVQRWIELSGKNKVLNVLSKQSEGNAVQWELALYCALPADQVTLDDWQEMFYLYCNAEPHLLPYGSNFVLNYLAVEPKAVYRIVSSLLKRGEDKQGYIQVLCGMFEQFQHMDQPFSLLLKEDFELLQRAYFTANELCSIGDYQEHLYNSMQDLDPDFSLKYIDCIHKRDVGVSRQEVDLSILWMRDDYLQIMEAVVALINTFGNWGSPSLGDLMRIQGNFDVEHGQVLERQKTFWNGFIEKNAQDTQLMKWLFKSLSLHSEVPFLDYLLILVKLNPDEKLFKELPLEPSSTGWSGSAVPVYQQKIENLKTFRLQLDPIEFSEHRRHIVRHISDLQDTIKYREKREWKKNWLR